MEAVAVDAAGFRAGVDAFAATSTFRLAAAAFAAAAFRAMTLALDATATSAFLLAASSSSAGTSSQPRTRPWHTAHGGHRGLRAQAGVHPGA